MSELSVGTLSGLAANGYVIDVASGSQLTQPGMILQVVSTSKTDAFSASISTGTITSDIMSATITPTSATSKILVSVQYSAASSESSALHAHLYIDGAPSDYRGNVSGSRVRAATSSVGGAISGAGSFGGMISYLHSPSTTSPVTYSLRFSHSAAITSFIFLNRSNTDTDNAQYPRTASSITLMEVAA